MLRTSTLQEGDEPTRSLERRQIGERLKRQRVGLLTRGGLQMVVDTDARGL